MERDATLVADPFHVTKLANTKLDECRRRVQNETLGHRGRKSDPLYRCRRLLTKAKERLHDKGHERLTGLLRAGDLQGDVATLWQAKEALRALCTRRSRPRPRVGHPGQRPEEKDYGSRPARRTNSLRIEARSLGRTRSAGNTRLPPRTRPTSPKDPPKRSTTSSSGSARRVWVHVVPELTDLFPRWPGPGVPLGCRQRRGAGLQRPASPKAPGSDRFFSEIGAEVHLPKPGGNVRWLLVTALGGSAKERLAKLSTMCLGNGAGGETT